MITQPPVQSGFAKYQGLPGTSNRYYWVQAIYPSGRSVLTGYFLAPNCGSLNTSGNSVSIEWTPTPGAIGYDVICVVNSSTEPTLNSTATIGLALGITSTNLLDQGQALFSWTYESGNGGTFGEIEIGVTQVTSGTDGRILFQDAGLVAEDANLTFDGTTLESSAIASDVLITNALTVATLPGTPVAGQRSFVTDSDAVSFTAGIGAIVSDGGSTAVPVVYDGTDWRIG